MSELPIKLELTAKNLNQVKADIGAQADEAVKQIAESFKTIGANLKAQIEQLPQTLQTSIDTLGHSLDESMADLKKTVDVNPIQDLKAGFKKALSGVADSFQGELEKIAKPFADFKEQLSSAFDPEELLQTLTGGVVENVNRLKDQVDQIPQGLRAGVAAVEKSVKDIGTNLAGSLNLDQWKSLRDKVKDIAANPGQVSSGDLTEVINSFTQLKEQALTIFSNPEGFLKGLSGGLIDSIHGLLQQVELIPRELKENIAGVGQSLNEAWTNLSGLFNGDGAGSILKELMTNPLQALFGGRANPLDQIKEQFLNIFNNPDGPLAGVTGSFQGIFQGLTQQMGQWSQQFIAPLVQSLGGTMNNLFGNLFSGFQGSASNGSGFWGNLISTIFSYFAYRANGGPVTGGSPYIVGEQGPELFVPSTSGIIVPNHQLGGSNSQGSAPPVTVNVINNSGQQVNARQESRFDGQSYVIDVWLDAMNRNVGGLRDIVMAGR